MRNQYRAAQIATACHETHVQIAATHPAWINTNGRTCGYMTSSCSCSDSCSESILIDTLATSAVSMGGPTRNRYKKTAAGKPVAGDGCLSTELDEANMAVVRSFRKWPCVAVVRPKCGAPFRAAPPPEYYGPYAAFLLCASCASWRMISVVPARRSSGVSQSWKNTTFMSGRTFAAWPWLRMKVTRRPGCAKELSRKVMTAPFGPASIFPTLARRQNALIAATLNR